MADFSPSNFIKPSFDTGFPQRTGKRQLLYFVPFEGLRFGGGGASAEAQRLVGGTITIARNRVK